jgi:hypothetical protein
LSTQETNYSSSNLRHRTTQARIAPHTNWHWRNQPPPHEGNMWVSHKVFHPQLPTVKMKNHMYLQILATD